MPLGGGRRMIKLGNVGVEAGDDYVGIAEIRRPPDNFFDASLIRSLADAFDFVAAQGSRAIVLCSQGKHFCAGADFTGRSGHARRIGAADAARELYDQALRLFQAEIPVVAAVQGAAVGGGLGLACAADFRVASPQSRFSANFARIGLHHGFGLSATLPAIVGQQRATDLLYTGRLAGPDDLRGAAMALAGELACAAPLAVRAIRATMRAGIAERVRAATDAEL